MKTYKPEIIVTASEDFAVTSADYLWNIITAIDRPLVAWPTGTTPLGIYKMLVEKYRSQKDVWGGMRYISLDEYAGLAPDDERLFQNWVGRELLDPAGVPAENRITFNSMAEDPQAEAEKMERRIAEEGPIDLAVLGLGGNGHIAFNEPGSAFDSLTRLITLSEDTRESNADYWGGIEHVPQRAYTLGLKTLSAAKHIVLLVSGAHKSAILDAALNGPITENVPATILRTAPKVTIISDEDAGEGSL